MQNNEIEAKRLIYSEATLGKSDLHDVSVMLQMLQSQVKPGQKIIDIGCGAGDLTKLLVENFKDNEICGADINKFEGMDETNIQFFKWDCNKPITDELKHQQFDHVIISHLILYIENPWGFMREIAKLVKPGGQVLVANANTESYRSLICYYFRGYQISCPPNYPGHINSPSAVESSRMLTRDNLFQIENIKFSGKGRVPGFQFNWQSVLPFLRCKRYSDAYFITAKRMN